ncbi:unnamed protein product [Rotaria sp. Silwood1]|nr:unnamed protein product [Rotaria sp. Silwood1]
MSHSTGFNSRPQSATVNDLNNDTRLDIIVANSGTDTVGIFFGSEDGTFQPQVSYSTGSGSQPYYVIVGDFNNDNRQDIVTANHGTNSIGILVGHGNGNFASVCFVSLDSSRPVSATAADLNNDMNLDIIGVNYDTSSIDILLGYGNASFSLQTKYSTGYDSHPHSVIVADLNRDNHLDIIISNSGTNNAAVFLGYGNGSFSFPQLYSTGVDSLPFTAVVGDLNGDNRLDIVVSNYGTSSVGALLGYGNGSFAKMKISYIDSEFRPYAMVIGDFNKDNILDVVVANPASSNIVVLHGSGNGSFTSQETYSTGFDSTPISIVVGDFNNDNQLDLATVNNGTNSVAVFLRYVVKSFANQTSYSLGAQSFPTFITLGDFNNDNQLDIVVAISNTNSVGILIGYINGTFAAQMTFSTGSYSDPRWINVADFNNDSLLDMAVAYHGTSNLGIFLGYGNGSFVLQKTFSTGYNSMPRSLATGDFNNDGLFDIVVANYRTNDIGIFFAYGNGIFADQKTISTGDNSSPISIAVGDFNNDGLLDIAIANYGTDNVGIILTYENGTFAAQIICSIGNGSAPHFVALEDFNNDSLLDIAVANSESHDVAIIFGCGNGSFEKMTKYSMGYGSYPVSLVVGDFNNDNIFDIAVSNSGANNIGILFGHRNGAFGMLTMYSLGDGSRPMSITTGNFNHDIWLDIVIANFYRNSVSVLLGLDNIDTANQASYSTGSGPHPYSVVVSDFNNDTLLDLMIVNSAHDNIGIRLGDGHDSFDDEIIYPIEINSRPQFATVGDFNQDHKVDIVIANTQKDSVTVAYGNGNGIFTSQEILSTGNGSSPISLAGGDINNDGRLDLIILNEGTSTLGVFLSFDYATFRNYSSFSTGTLSNPSSIALGDFNNDSLLDVAVANSMTNNVGIFLGYGNGTLAAQKIYPTGIRSQSMFVIVSDFNNDNILDIAVANYGGNNVGILLGYGNGTFSAQKTLFTGYRSAPSWVAIGDFNKDGLLDIAVANSGTNNLGIFLSHGNGNFASQITFPTGLNSMPRSLATGDFNDDSLLDIVVANYFGDNIGILLGRSNGTFATQKTLYTGNHSAPFSVAIDDFNNDSLLDIAVANSGTNNLGIFLGYGNESFAPQMTYSTGDNSIPLRLTIGDLNNDNRPDIVVTNYGANNVGIFFGYDDGSFTQQMTVATGNGSKPNAVAIGNLNTNNRSDIIVANFQSNDVMILLRDSSQGFLSMTTYSIGTDSHPQSMIIADFNNDSHLDIIVANYGNDNIGILCGYGNGNFMKPITYTTGNGSQPCSIAVGDFNNDSLLDIVVANAGTNNLCIFVGYGNGTCSTITPYLTEDSSLPYSVAVSDFNNDNFLDIIVANSGSNYVVILFGDGRGNFLKPKSYLLGYGSRPYSVAVGDFNRDNWIDIVVADYGTDNVKILLQTCDNI